MQRILPPFGKLLSVRLEISVKLKVPVYIFVGKNSFNLAKQEIESGGIALALLKASDHYMYNWLANDLRFIICASNDCEETELQIFALRLLAEKAKHVLIHFRNTMSYFMSNRDDLVKLIKQARPDFVESLPSDSNIKPINEQSAQMLESPIPLSETSCIKFPLSSLPPSLKDVAVLLHKTINTPVELCVQTILSTLSLASQSLVNVRIGDRVFPPSLFCLSIADSGERKTAVFNAVLAPVVEYEKILQAEFLKDMQHYQQNIEAAKSIQTDIRKPLKPILTISDPTIEGIHKYYDGGQSSLGLFNDEAGSFLAGYGMKPEHRDKTITHLSSLFSGSAISKLRKGDEDIKMYNKRLAMHLMVQPTLVSKILSDEHLLDQGFLARFLITKPKSLVGYRQYSTDTYTDKPIYKDFFKRMIKLLSAPKSFEADLENTLKPREIFLTEEAENCYKEFFNAVESECRPEGIFREIRSCATRAPEVATRIAACFSMYADSNAEHISLDDMQSAITLMYYYLQQSLHLIKPEIDLENSSHYQLKNHAQEMIGWLINHAKKKDLKTFQARYIAQRCPEKFREKSIFTEIMTILEDHSYITKITDENGRKVSYVLNDELVK
jgi:hypothetical protein